MQEEKDLLLAIHMAKENEDIYLTKERKVLISKDQQYISSFYLSQNRVSSLEQTFANVLNTDNNDEDYAIYYGDEEIRENDKTKVLVLRNQLSKITWNEFLNDYPNILVNDEEISKLIDKFDCVFSKDLEKILTYSTYGVSFSGELDARLFSFEEKLEKTYMHEGELLLPIAEHGKAVICYQCSKRYFVRLENEVIVNTSTELEDVIVDINKEIDDSILNIEAQLEKLSIGTIKKIDLPDEDGIEIREKTIEVDGTEVNVKINDDAYFDMSALVALVDNKIDELIAMQKEEEKSKVATIKTKLEKMTQKNEEAKARIKEREEAKKAYRLDIVSSLKKVSANYAFNLNETAKLIVSHLPFYEQKESLTIIAVPEIEENDYSVIEGRNIDLGRIVLKTISLNKQKAVFEVVKAPLVVDMQGNSLKKGSKLELEFDKEKSFRLNKSGAMETWAITLDKASFERELRNIEYGRIMKLLKETESYKKYGEIEKFETKNSVMLFLYFVMQNGDEKVQAELEKIIKNKEKLYEEFISKYNVEQAVLEKDLLASFTDKEKFIEKVNFVRGLIDSNWLDYPRYIFGQHRYFERDLLMEDYINYRNDSLSVEAFRLYLEKLFEEFNLFKKLDIEAKENLDLCLDYLSRVYKNDTVYGETLKYEVEKQILIDESEEELSLLISKLCHRGISDYNDFKEYEYLVQELYRKGELKYPIFSDKFEVGSVKGAI